MQNSLYSKHIEHLRARDCFKHFTDINWAHLSWHYPPPQSCSFPLFFLYTGVGKSRFTVVHMEKDMQVMITVIALLTQKNVTVAHQPTFARPCTSFLLPFPPPSCQVCHWPSFALLQACRFPPV